MNPFVFDLLVYHIHDEGRSYFLKEMLMKEEEVIEIDDITLKFELGFKLCRFSMKRGNLIETESFTGQYFPTFGKDKTFGHCYIFRG